MEKLKEPHAHPLKAVLLRRSILVIDDSPDTLALHKIILEADGFEVFTAESGAEGLEILSEMPDPNLIILDIQMADMTGSDFLLMLEEKKPNIIEDIPIVFFTGMDAIPKSKAAGFIRKPADMDKFLTDVHRFVEMGYHPPYKH